MATASRALTDKGSAGKVASAGLAGGRRASCPAPRATDNRPGTRQGSGRRLLRKGQKPAPPTAPADRPNVPETRRAARNPPPQRRATLGDPPP
eukprot:1372801-Alexandrium_andersonii.AAC.1